MFLIANKAPLPPPPPFPPHRQRRGAADTGGHTERGTLQVLQLEDASPLLIIQMGIIQI